MDNNKPNILSLFATPVMHVQLDLDLEKLTEFTFQIQNKDKKGIQHSNMGGWQSDDVSKENHEEFINLKKEINHYLQIYHSEIFQTMKFKGNVTQSLVNMWLNINEKHHYNEWHIHPYCTLSGTYYIKHDNSVENGNILFKHPNSPYNKITHWPHDLIEKNNEITATIIPFIPESNILLIFPAWVEHKTEGNLKDTSRISLSFNSITMEKKP